MIYKYKILLHEKTLHLATPDYHKVYDLKDNYKLCITIDIRDTKMMLILSILNNKHEILEETAYKYVYNKEITENNIFKLCRTYKIKIKKNSEVFMIKLFHEKLFAQLDNSYAIEDVKNEIQFTDIKNSYETIDLCIFMMSRDKDFETSSLFQNKLIYFGYKTFNELCDNNDLELLANKLIIEKTESLFSLTELFCGMATIYLNSENNLMSIFWKRILPEYDNLHESKMKYLEPYFVY